MIHLPNERDPVELLAEEFASRCRRGECPSVSEYAAEHPQFAGRIEELFPALAMMEQLRVEEKARREAVVRRTRFAGPPEQLGDFEIIREIGRGGMGIVYEAEQRSLARRVAVKVLPKHVLLLDRHLKRFQREAQTAARLRHTNIVPVFGVGDQDGLHYYVMPLVRGVGLDEIIRELRDDRDVSRGGSPPGDAAGNSGRDIHTMVAILIAEKFAAAPSIARDAQSGAGESPGGLADTSRPRGSSTRKLLRPNGANPRGGKLEESFGVPGRVDDGLPASHWRMVAHVGVQAAEALDYAHAHGTLHRDVKPGNLLVDGEGVVCVADFGLARGVDPTGLSRSGEVVGTLRYMAPEQLRGAADARSDVYSLGLTLYELLTLRSAFADTDRRHCLQGQVGPEPVRPRKLDPTVPPDLETIVLKCLAHEPSKRYATAGALAADLRRFLEDRPIRARRASWIERGWRWCRRNRALAAVSALAAMLLIAVAVTALTGYTHTRTAYADARVALARAEATSQLSLEVLDDIYLQLSPERVWISSDSDAGGEACACVGLRSGDTSASAAERAAMQVQASRETASLLENLLVFYDRLAEQASDDSQVMLQSAIASRRVGDIRQRLGQIDQAEREYVRAVERLASLQTGAEADARICTERARNHNEIGNVRSARQESARAYESHQTALAVLESLGQTDRLPEASRYELARTLYFLSSKRPGADGSLNRREPVEDAASRWPNPSADNDYRKSAIRSLQQLTRENPDVPDYRFLLALCHRPSGSGPTSPRMSNRARGRERAIRILEQLTSQYPSVVDYRYELTATYAWIPVGLFPWQGHAPVPPEAEPSLLKALDESEWLVAHNPTIPHYACSRALILAKLGTVCWRTRRPAEAEDFFRKALEAQSSVISGFPDLPSHHRVLLEFLRLRLGQVCLDRGTGTRDPDAAGKLRELLETCTEHLTELTARPELAEDRLAWSSLPLAYHALSCVLAEAGETKKAQEARRKGEAIRGEMAGKRNGGDPSCPPNHLSTAASPAGARGGGRVRVASQG